MVFQHRTAFPLDNHNQCDMRNDQEHWTSLDRACMVYFPLKKKLFRIQISKFNSIIEIINLTVMVRIGGAPTRSVDQIANVNLNQWIDAQKFDVFRFNHLSWELYESNVVAISSRVIERMLWKRKHEFIFDKSISSLFILTRIILSAW